MQSVLTSDLSLEAQLSTNDGLLVLGPYVSPILPTRKVPGL